MAFRKLLLFSGILATIARQYTSAAEEDLKNIIPRHYVIKIVPYYESDIFHGMSSASFFVRNETRTITLNSKNIVIYEASVSATCRSLPRGIPQNSTDAKINGHVYTPTREEKNDTNKILRLSFADTLLPGNYCLNIEFFGVINTNDKGLFRVPFESNGGDRTWILSTQTITGAHEVFPHFDDSTAKATFDISIQHYVSEIALSSMPTRYSEPVCTNNARMWTHFRTTPPMAANAVAILVIPRFMNVTSASSGDIRMWNRNVTLPGSLRYDPSRVEVAEKIMSFFRIELGEPKTPQINFIAIPGFQYDTIAKLGLVLHREEDVMFDGEFPATSNVQRSAVSRFVARQMALQWFIGSVVQPSLWSYQWFNAAAEFFGIYALDMLFGSSKAMSWFVAHTVRDSLHLDVDNLMEPIVERRNTSSNTRHLRVPPFIKIPAVLHMVEDTLGELFWNYTKAILLNAPSVYNIWSCLLSDVSAQSVSDEKSCTFNWKWIQTSNYPLLSVQPMNDRYDVYMQDVSLNTAGQYNGSQYKVLFTFGFMFDAQDIWVQYYNLFRSPVILSHKDSLCPPVVNINQTGYYRVTHNYEAWILTMQRCNTDAPWYRKLPALSLGQIIDDEYHLLARKIKQPRFFWCNIMQYLSAVQKYEVWLPAIRLLEDISGFLPFAMEDDLFDFKVLLQNHLDIFFSYIIYSGSDEDLFRVRLQYEAFKWTCLLVSANCETLTDRQLSGFNNSILEKKEQRRTYLWQEWIPCNTSRFKEMNVTVLKKIILHSKFKNNFDNTVAKYIPCLKYNTVAEFLSEEHRLHEREHIILFHSLVAKRPHNYDKYHIKTILYDFYLLKPRVMKAATALCIIINHTYSIPSLRWLLHLLLYSERYFKYFEVKNRRAVVLKIRIRTFQIQRHTNRFKQLWSPQCRRK